jgi:ribosomal peptide maturation radical SAM protein 1
MFDVCLVGMPFAAVERPSIALGLLQAILKQAGIPTTTIYANIQFATEVGLADYTLWEDALRDLTFSLAAFPEFQPNCDAQLRRSFRRLPGYVKDSGRFDTEESFFNATRKLREKATGFVDETARAVVNTGARIVGCTSMYWQHTASLALLRRVKEFDPSIVTMLGGANCESVMGLANHRNFSWVDYVVSGEADDFIAELCKLSLVKGRDITAAELPFGVFGPTHRTFGYPSSNNGDGAPRAACRNLGVLPAPDYDDYFRTLRASSLAESVSPGLLVETARGCWYGAVHQCKFCGISEVGMAYHSKAPEKVIAELDQLEQRYGVSNFEVTDNILDMSYFKTVIPRLAEHPNGRRIFWETKANLKRAQVEMLAKAGVIWIQPGIESLDSRVLKLMDKGVQGSQNVQLLKWCREFGIRLSWNFLWGFPGEDDQWYSELAEKLFLLEHLQSPRLMVRLRYDRYSVYQARAAEYGLKLEPTPFMFLTYPVSSEEMMDLTYYFETAKNGDSGKETPRPGVKAMNDAVRQWQQRFWRGLPSILSLTDDGTSLEILDTRNCAAEMITTLEGLDRKVYLACDDGPSQTKLPALLQKDYGISTRAEEIEGVVANLRRRNLIIDLDDRLVALAVRGSLPKLPTPDQFPGGFSMPLPSKNSKVETSSAWADPTPC